MARGMVSVFPGILPAIISVAPNSPMARAKDRTVPAMIPFFDSGSIILRNVSNSECPRVYEALTRFRSIDSMAAREVFIMSGSATTKDASTAAYQVNMMLKPVEPYRDLPSNPFLPKSTIR